MFNKGNKKINKKFNKEFVGDGNAIPSVLVLIGAVFIGIGVYSGEAAVVLRKAINICLECIGIG